jgi:hypothetical protein
MRDERAAHAVAAVPESIRFKTFHLIGSDGRGFSGGDAVIQTLASVKATSWLGKILSKRPFPALVGAFYALLVKTKGVVGRAVRDAPGPERWP